MSIGPYEPSVHDREAEEEPPVGESSEAPPAAARPQVATPAAPRPISGNKGSKGQGGGDGRPGGGGVAAARAASPAEAAAPAEKAAPDVRAAVRERIKSIEDRARSLAAGGDLVSTQLAGQAIKLAQRVAEAASRGRSQALLEAGRAVRGDRKAGAHERTIMVMADLVSSARAGLDAALRDAPPGDDRDRLEVVADVFADLDVCCRELAAGIASHNMARRKMFLPKAAETVDKAKEKLATAAKTEVKKK